MNALELKKFLNTVFDEDEIVVDDGNEKKPASKIIFVEKLEIDGKRQLILHI